MDDFEEKNSNFIVVEESFDFEERAKLEKYYLFGFLKKNIKNLKYR